MSPIHFYAPHSLDVSLYVWMGNMFGCLHMFGWPPVCLDALHTICLDAPCMF